jgi:hypothetical protein
MSLFQSDPIFFIPAKYIYHVAAALFSVVGAATVYAFRKASEFVKKQSERLERIETVQGVQAENHLCTIQGNTGKTVEILEKMQVGQAEFNGYLKGFLNKE